MKIEIPDIADSAELKPLIEQIQAIIDREAGAFVPKNGESV